MADMCHSRQCSDQALRNHQRCRGQLGVNQSDMDVSSSLGAPVSLFGIRLPADLAMMLHDLRISHRVAETPTADQS